MAEGRRASGELVGNFESQVGTGCRPVAPLQVLALCHIAVGPQMSLHWLHKVRAASARSQGGRLEAVAAEEEPGHITPPLDRGCDAGCALRAVPPSRPALR